jgi:two-component system, OmpR family, KDP operon response regulator KdpE
VAALGAGAQENVATRLVHFRTKRECRIVRGRMAMPGCRPILAQFEAWHALCFRGVMRATNPGWTEHTADPSPLLLVVDDEPAMCRFLGASLSSRGYRLLEASTGNDALGKAATRSPDLVLLDLGLPDMDGLEVTRRLRQWALFPIIVISARGREEDKILALDAGADDYLTKPFGTGELAARIRVALKNAATNRAGTAPVPMITVGALQLDLERHAVFASGREVHLTPTEFKLFATLMKHAGRVLTHRQLLQEVWGEKYAHNTQYLRVYMVQLRHKLEADPARPRHLTTVPAIGYRLRTC